MKILLVGINAKYSHQNLALYYIKQYAKSNIKILEFNINQNIEGIYREILKEKADIIGFSSYIWNIEFIQRLTYDLKTSNPRTTIIWGGPEVSFDTEELLRENFGVDIIIRGEGEKTAKELISTIESDGDLSKIDGISYKMDGEIFINPDRELIQNLDEIPSPFFDMEVQKGKLMYYEMSRGCPFKCAYCLSSTIKGVRYFSEDRIKSDLLKIMEYDVQTVKLVDRTFNSNEDFSIRIMEFIKDHAPEGMCFHMELMAHMISDKFLDFLKDIPVGLFQFEIGIQSTNHETLGEIYRITDLEKLGHSVKTIRSYNNIHQHVDLIAGLPYEDYESFKNSFNFAYSLGAEKLQLGFLKLLRGSRLRIDAEKLGLKYSKYPPYEIIYTDWMSPMELRRLSIIEDVVEKYSNEDYFKWTLEFLIDEENPFGFFEDFSVFWEEKNYHMKSHTRESLYKIFSEYLEGKAIYEATLELLRLDYMLNQNSILKSYLNPQGIDLKLYHDLLRDEKIRNDFEISMDIPTKKLINDFKFEGFGFGGQRAIFGFYYKKEGTIRLDITEDYERITNGIS